MNFYDPAWLDQWHRKFRRQQHDPRRRQRVQVVVTRPLARVVVDRVEILAADGAGVRFDVCRN